MKLAQFKAGKIFNPVKGKIKNHKLVYSQVELSVPARLNAMCFDLKTLVNSYKKKIYSAGELAFSVNADTYTKIIIKKEKNRKVIVENKTSRKAIVKHAAIIMMKVLNIQNDIVVDAYNKFDYPHAGFGSSSSLITSVVYAINYAFGKPLSKRQMALLISQNHGEEITGKDDELIHVQCNGGSPSVALYGGGIQIIVGETDLILREDIPKKYIFVFGIPNFYEKLDAKELMQREEKAFNGMIKSSQDYSFEIAWKVLHQLLPAIKNQKMKYIGDLIEYYRFETGSLKNDNILWKDLLALMVSLKKYREGGTKILSISSCGPAVYALTTDADKIEKVFKSKGMKTFRLKPNNSGLNILSAIS